MFKVKISSQIHGQLSIDLPTQAEADAYVQDVTASQHWGRNAYDRVITEAIVNDDGSVTPAVTERIPAEYEVVVEDITAQVEQQKRNEESLKYLADTDWLAIRQIETGIPVPEDIRLARAEARRMIVK